MHSSAMQRISHLSSSHAKDFENDGCGWLPSQTTTVKIGDQAQRSMGMCPSDPASIEVLSLSAIVLSVRSAAEASSGTGKAAACRLAGQAAGVGSVCQLRARSYLAASPVSSEAAALLTNRASILGPAMWDARQGMGAHPTHQGVPGGHHWSSSSFWMRFSRADRIPLCRLAVFS